MDCSSLLFFPDLLLRIYAWFELARVKLYRNDDLKGKQDYILPVSGRFELGRFRVTGSRLYVPILSILHARHRVCNELHFHALSRYYLSSAFWPKFLLSPGFIVWLNGSYGFVISSCCFRRPLSWAKFWYCSVLNGPHIQRTPCIKRTIAQYVLGEIHLVADRLEGLEWFAFHNLKFTFPSVYCFYSSYFKSYSTVFLMFLLYGNLVKARPENGRVLYGAHLSAKLPEERIKSLSEFKISPYWPCPHESLGSNFVVPCQSWKNGTEFIACL